MIAARKVALRVNGMQVTKATLRRGETEMQLVIADPLVGDFPADRSSFLELLELVHPPGIRSRLPNGGWRKVSLRILIALMSGGIVRVVGHG